MSQSLTSHRVLVLDVFGTLINIEQGIKSALSAYPPFSTDTQKDTNIQQWSPSEALLAFASVEKDLCAQFPTMSYTNLLVLAHRTLCRRVSGISDDMSQEDGPFEIEETDAGAAPSTSATKEEDLGREGGEKKRGTALDNGGLEDDEHTAFAKHVLASPPFPDAKDGLRRLARHFQLVIPNRPHHHSPPVPQLKMHLPLLPFPSSFTHKIACLQNYTVYHQRNS